MAEASILQKKGITLTTTDDLSFQRKRHCSAPQDSASTFALLTTHEYASKILSGLDHLRESGLLCDYTLIAGGLELHVHRVVMVACSDYFRAMLMGDMRESKESSVQLQGITGTGLQAVIDFAYKGWLKVNLETVEEILAAASHLQVSEAVELCARFLDHAVTVENCVDILNITELYSLTKSQAKVRTFILKNFELIADCDEFFKLSCAQLASLLSENSLCVQSEYILFELVLKWIEFEEAERRLNIAALMRNIRLPLLSGEELVEKVSRVEMMTSNDECFKLLVEAKDYHIIVNKQPLLQSSRTHVRSEKHRLVICHDENLECLDFETGHHTYLKDNPIPLYNPCVCVVDNFMYACGGKYDSNENNDIATARCFRYDPRFDTWFELSAMNEARQDFVIVPFNSSLYAIAGQDENMVMYTVEQFNISNNEWVMCSNIASAIYGHSGALCFKRIYISGGQKFDGHSKGFMSYDPVTDVWRDEPPMLTPRSNHNMAEVGGRLYVVGGNVEDSYGFPVPVTSIEMFVPVTGMWVCCEATLNIREAGAAVLESRIYIVGGINGQHYYSDKVLQYKTDTDEIITMEKLSTRIHGRACCILQLPRYI